MPTTPGRFTGRAGSGSPGRVRRAIDGAIVGDKRYGDSLEIDPKTKRLNLKLPADSPLTVTKRGLEFDVSKLGDKNRDPMRAITDVDETTATAATNAAKLNEILAELRRTKRLKGFGT